MKLWIIVIMLFLFTLSLRLWNLEMVGRWWDEQWYAEKGYTLVELALKHDFNNPYWYTIAADHPPLPNYFYGLASYADLIRYDNNAKMLQPGNIKGAPIFHYDLTNTKLVSVIISVLAVLLVFFIGVRYFSYYIGITAAIILAMLPHFLGYSQFVVLETWIMLFFTACAFSYYLYLETNKRSLLILTGILTGLNLEIKQSDILIFGLYIATYFYWKHITKNKKISIMHLVWIGIIALITCFIVWPMPWIHMKEFLSYTYDLWFKDSGNVPELLFGIHMGARSFFYVVAFFITTPLVILLLTFVGLKISWTERKKWIFGALVIWFLVPFLMSFFHHRQNMVRYIIQFYAPMALLAAIGFEYLIQRFTKSNILKFSLLAPLFVYLMIILSSITPYYLNYFNELVGGTKNVYEKKLFFLGWFGEGLKGPGVFVANDAPPNATVGMALNPQQTLYKVDNLKYETFDPKKRYDYVVVNYFNVIRIGFDESILKEDYNLVYTEKADGADLAHVYKHK